MSYEYFSIGTQRFTVQGFIGATDPAYAIRILHVSAVGSASNAQLVISSTAATTTATDTTTPYITLPLTTSGTNMTAEWDSHYGRLFDSGKALLHTYTGFSYAVVEYVVLRK